MGHLASRVAYKNLEDRINWFTWGAPVSGTLHILDHERAGHIVEEAEYIGLGRQTIQIHLLG